MGELYGPLRAVSEQEAERQFPGAVTIVRPGLIVGPGDETDRFTYWPVRLARGGEVLAPGHGSDPVQFIDARGLAEWTIRMAESRTLGVFNATGPDRPLTMTGMLDGIAGTVDADARLTCVPTEFLEARQVSAWGDLPVWMPGQGDSAGFARRDIGSASRVGSRSGRCRRPRPTPWRGSDSSRPNGRPSYAPASRPFAKPSCWRPGRRARRPGASRRG